MSEGVSIGSVVRVVERGVSGDANIKCGAYPYWWMWFSEGVFWPYMFWKIISTFGL